MNDEKMQAEYKALSESLRDFIIKSEPEPILAIYAMASQLAILLASFKLTHGNDISEYIIDHVRTVLSNLPTILPEEKK